MGLDMYIDAKHKDWFKLQEEKEKLLNRIKETKKFLYCVLQNSKDIDELKQLIDNKLLININRDKLIGKLLCGYYNVEEMELCLFNINPITFEADNNMKRQIASAAIDTLEKIIPPDVLQILRKLTDEVRTISSMQEELIVKLAYWRKANAIHNWFVKNVQNGVDNCKPYKLEKKHLEDLLDTLNKVQDVETAKQYLPPKDGFFFGSTEIDDYYFKVIEETKHKIKYILDKYDHWKQKGYDIYYKASW